MSSSHGTDAWGLIGTVLDGRYRIEGVAGRGGHGVVYRALHLGFDLPVAVKVLRSRDCDDEDARQALLDSFRREGRLLSQLSALHPAFVQAKEAGTLLRPDGNTAPFLVLEWLDGAGLDREIKQRRALHTPAFSLAEAFGLLDAAANGLALAHARGISHRDLKPGNLFVVSRDGTAKVKVLDLGLAKVIEPTLSTAARFLETRHTRHSFTHAYGAPEQWLSRLGASGPWTDVHAWALICVELISGKPALSGRSSEHLMGACLDAARPTLRSLGVDASDAVEAVFMRALAVQPRERYPDLGAFWRALRAAAGIRAVKELEATRLVALAPIVPRSKTSASAPETAPPTESRSQGFAAVARNTGRRSRANVALGAAALVCGAAGWVLVSDRANTQASAEGPQRSAPRGADSPQRRPALPDSPTAARQQPAQTTSTAPAPSAPSAKRLALRSFVAPAHSAPAAVAPAHSAPAAVAPGASLPDVQPLPPRSFRRFD